MTSAAWQLVIALLAVAAAVAVLARRVYRLVRGSGRSGCGSGGCDGCATNAPQAGAQPRPLVTLNVATTLSEASDARRRQDA